CFGCQANGNAIRFLMDIDNRNFIEVMKELSSSTGIELPKDNTENKKLSYTRQVTKPPVTKTNTAEPVTSQQPSDESYNTLEPVFFD
ncbi:CHC2 zinc finger domain-containing protein, partial [Acinetobacter baumannii]